MCAQREQGPSQRGLLSFGLQRLRCVMNWASSHKTAADFRLKLKHQT